MNIIILEQSEKTQATLGQLLKEEGGFSNLQFFPNELSAKENANWLEAEMILLENTSMLPSKIQLIRWIKQNHPHITLIEHSLHANGAISYSSL